MTASEGKVPRPLLGSLPAFATQGVNISAPKVGYEEEGSPFCPVGVQEVLPCLQHPPKFGMELQLVGLLSYKLH